MAIQHTRWQGEAIIDLKNHTLLQTAKTRTREFGVACIIDIRCKENSGLPAHHVEDMYPKDENKI